MTTILRQVAILIAVIAGAYGLLVFYEASRYEPVDATVTAIEELCSLHKFERDGFTNRAVLTTPMTCEEAENFKHSRPKYRDTEVNRATFVKFRYVSPADGRRYMGSFKQARHADGVPIRVGDRLPILAHTDDPVNYKQAD